MTARRTAPYHVYFSLGLCRAVKDYAGAVPSTELAGHTDIDALGGAGDGVKTRTITRPPITLLENTVVGRCL